MRAPLACFDPESYRKSRKELASAIGMQFGLVEGRIAWLDKARKPVGHVAVRAILSWAGSNNSVLWGWQNQDLARSGAPVLPKTPMSGAGSLEDTGDDEARSLALQAASAAGAECVIRLQLGTTVLYVAVDRFELGGPGAFSQETLHDSARAFIHKALAAIAQRLHANELEQARAVALAALAQLEQNGRGVWASGLRSEELRRGIAAIELAAISEDVAPVVQAISAALATH